MSYIYVDEAGTSPNEPITVVVGLIVRNEDHKSLIEERIQSALSDVPAEFSEGYIFHASDITNTRLYDDRWPWEQRLDLLLTMMYLPRLLNIPITYSIMRRTAPYMENIGKIPLNKSQWHHLQAFSHCVTEADRFLRQHTSMDETASLIAEDMGKLRRILGLLPKAWKTSSFTYESDGFIPTEMQKANGDRPLPVTINVTMIKDEVRFVKKYEEPIMQIADACAFGIRRFFAELPLGQEYIQAMLANTPNLNDFRGPASWGTFSSQPRRDAANK